MVFTYGFIAAAEEDADKEDKETDKKETPKKKGKAKFLHGHQCGTHIIKEFNRWYTYRFTKFMNKFVSKYACIEIIHSMHLIT